MAQPWYVSPEQLMKDRADYARKGIARGKSVIAAPYRDGLLLVAENPSASLRKISEVYDRIAFAAVGKYNEFEQLRVAGIRLADVRGFTYHRRDVSARALANAYANALGAAFTEGSKPFEVELLVCELADDDVYVYDILYDGTIADREGAVVIGGEAEEVGERLQRAWDADLDRPAALLAARDALAGEGEERRELTGAELEVAGLERGRGRRAFFRLRPDRIDAELAQAAGA